MSFNDRVRKHPYLIVAVAVGLLALAFVANAVKSRFFVLPTMHPKRGPIVEAVYGLGTVTATRTYTLKIGVTSHVQEIYVLEGDQVRKGAPLARLSDAGVQHAPFDGTITSVPYKAGETVFPQTPVVALVDLTDLYILVSLEEQAALHVRPGQGARLSFETIRGEKITGKVRSIYPQDGQFLVRIDVAKFPAGVLPGMTADVAIEVARRDEALLVPVSAVNAGKVIVATGGHRRKVDVRIGTVDGEWAEVTSGDLSIKDEVVVRESK